MATHPPFSQNGRHLALVRVGGTIEGGTTFYHPIEIDGHRFVKDFRVRLPEGGEVAERSITTCNI